METKPLTLKADDFTQLRQGPLRMYFPVDPDTTRRLKQLKYVVDGRNPLPWAKRLLRWLKRR